MTPRERILALAAGDSAPKPVVSWPCPNQAASDILIRKVSSPLVAERGELLLAEIHSPFGRAIAAGIDLNAALRQNPSAGAEQLDSLVEEVRGEIASALDRGVDGIFYVLHGACPKWCTPMQYGGFYLERDRELLNVASSAAFNVVFVAGDDEVYFDCVSDLPAAAFAWDSTSTGVTAGQMRVMRTGLLLCADPASDLILAAKPGSISEGLEARKTANV